jgi:glutamine amidotransferase
VLTLRSPKIAVIDYGAGNIQSVLNAMRRIGLENTFLTNSVSDIRLSDAYILPGVGAFGHCMRNLTNTGLIPALEREILTKKKPMNKLVSVIKLSSNRKTVLKTRLSS